MRRYTRTIQRIGAIPVGLKEVSPRPGRITDLIDVKLGKGRTEDTRNADEFFQGITAVREALRGSHADHVATNAVRGVEDR